MIQADILVIGSGLAGLTFAIKAAEKYPEKKVAVLSKEEVTQSNSAFAQGGIAIVSDFGKDNFSQHISDTLMAGAGLCDQVVVKMVVEDGPRVLDQLLAWGVDFDYEKGALALGKEGGHSKARIVHHKDQTGKAIVEAAIYQAAQFSNIIFYPFHMGIDLLIQEVNQMSRCVGVKVLEKKTAQLYNCFAEVVILATGGAGQLYESTTNPAIATGDGIAMATRAGLSIKGMEFIQFHPTALFQKQVNQAFLITEALRGHGAILRNAKGERYMVDYDKRLELAPRDIVARANYQEANEAGYVWLDCSEIAEKELARHFPMIYSYCQSLGINLPHDYIPVTTSAHYLCGGIVTGLSGETAFSGLYALGECAYTGLHGGNRLASNSLLEALVFPEKAFHHWVKCQKDYSVETEHFIGNRFIGKCFSNAEECKKLQNAKEAIKSLMSKYAGIVRSDDGLVKGMEEVKAVQSLLSSIIKPSLSWEAQEVENLLLLAKSVLQQSMQRNENVGGFFNVTKVSVKDL